MKMIKKQSNASLADKIADVLKAAPVSFNPDEEILDDTTAKLSDFDNEEEDDKEEEALLSKFRTQTVDLLGDVDSRYAGKRGSRKDLHDDSSSEISVDEDQEGEMSSGDSVYEDEGESQSDNEDVDERGSNEELSDVAPDERNFQHFSQIDDSTQMKKGFCVRNQLNIWENLLEMRIQMQKCLMAANKLPQTAQFTLLSKQDQGFRDKAKETETNVQLLLQKLLQLQDLVIKQYPETKKLTKKGESGKSKICNEESDEEIISSSDEGHESEEESSDENIQNQSAKRRKLNDFENSISTIHDKYKEYRNTTIENWNNKTRSSLAKSSSQPHSVVSQINHILGDRIKLIKRTQLKKSDYHILGTDNNEDNSGEVNQVEEYNTEIYDDTDFYHQLLRELIEAKSADITDPVQLGRQWIQLQNLRSKMKRKVDTRATKGRKIRYAVHSKLVNFMAPIDKQSWTEEAKTELYSSLFGKIQKRN